MVAEEGMVTWQERSWSGGVKGGVEGVEGRRGENGL